MNLTVIGGGSVNWMRYLMRDVYLMDEVEGGEIRLVDPNREHVEAVAGMLNRFNQVRGKSYQVKIIEDRREALNGADFVMTTFSPGAMDAFWNDLELPIKYGIRQPVSMTVGPCGISASLRTAPVAYDIVEEMETECPGAWLLNVTNPMSVVTGAMSRAAVKTTVVGLCHEFHCLPAYLGPMLGLEKPAGMDTLEYLYRWLPEQGFQYQVAGVNHFIWLTEARLHGEDVLPKLRAYCEAHWELGDGGKQEGGSDGSRSFRNRGAVKFALCRQLGYLPLVGDRHLVEFLPSLCNQRNGWAMKYDVQKTTVDARRFMKSEQLRQIQAIAAGQAEISWERSGEEMVQMIRAVTTGTSTPAIVNIPNRGQISNLPEGSVVETLATVSREGVQPVSAGALPGSIGSLCRLHADIHELTLRAALEGSRELLIEALSLDPLSAGADFSELPQLADELLLANREWLPRFFR